ncbi:MAG: hypothetical protein JJE18_01575 [Eubacteriaceae bacterium]|nr:hypothetical protein [Eubacteriaceae bacterium]
MAEYENKDRKCECWKCELSGKCAYKDKFQRLPDELGKCAKLPKNSGKLKY